MLLAVECERTGQRVYVSCGFHDRIGDVAELARRRLNTEIEDPTFQRRDEVITRRTDKIVRHFSYGDSVKLVSSLKLC